MFNPFTFYAYDSLGRMDTVYRYIGAQKFAIDRLQKISYTYDALGRLDKKQIYANASSAQVVNASRFEYNALGQVSQVFDKDDKSMVAYAYNTLGQLIEAQLYGKFKVAWTYVCPAKFSLYPEPN